MSTLHLRSVPTPRPEIEPSVTGEPGRNPAEGTRHPGLRERKREKLRERLVDVGMRLFIERGFDRVSIEDVVDEVDVSVRTFFRYFPSKGALVVAWHEKLNNELVRRVLTQPTSTPPLIAAHRAMAALIEAYEQDREKALGIARLTQATVSVQAELAGSNQRLQRELADGIAARWALPPQSLVAPTAAAAVIALANIAVGAWIARDGAGSPSALVDDAFETLAGMLSTDGDSTARKRRSARRA